MPLLPVPEAQTRLLALAEPLPSETVPLAQAAGRWASADVHARRTQPAHDLSAMDGYAIRFDDLPGPWAVTGEVAAGAAPDRAIGAGEAMRIFTGAMVPTGADTVIVQEDTALSDGRLLLTGESPGSRGRHIRRRANPGSRR